MINVSEKKICELTLDDLLDMPTWKCRRGANNIEYASPYPGISDLVGDEWCLSKVIYQLHCGKQLTGFIVDVYQLTDFYIFVGGSQFYLSNLEFVERKEAEALSEIVKVSLNEIFPIKFECYLKHWGKEIGGNLRYWV